MYSILQILNTSSETADGFNTYFSNIATDHLKQSITSVNNEFNDYLKAAGGVQQCGQGRGQKLANFCGCSLCMIRGIWTVAVSQ